MKQNQKAIAYAVGVIVVLALVVWLAGKPTPAPMPTTSPSASVSTTATPVKTLVPPSTPTGAMPKSYGDAVTAYANARIQFDMYCQATPKTSVFKNGATIMLDNRSGDARTVKVNGVSYYMAGYGWRLVTLSLPVSKLPASLDIDCGSAQNVGTILLQK